MANEPLTEIEKKAETKAALEAQSWEFLDKIINIVSNFSQDVQNMIMEYGQILNDAGMVYVHEIVRTRRSKKKVMEQLQLQSVSTPGQQQSQKQQ
jgi:hypothetical protein